MVRLLLILGWLTGTAAAIGALLLAGSDIQAILSIFFAALGLGLILIGALLIVSTIVQRHEIAGGDATDLRAGR